MNSLIRLTIAQVSLCRSRSSYLENNIQGALMHATKSISLLALAVFATANIAPALAARPADLTIEEVMQAPYPSSLIASTKSNSVAWVFDTKGCRNVWLSQGGHARAVTAYTLDDGFDIGDVALAPDASALAFVRGQSIEDDTPANVTNSADGAAPKEVFLVAASGGTPRKLGVGHSPSFSPDGTRLVFLDKGLILSTALAEGAAATPIIVDQGRIASVTFS